MVVLSLKTKITTPRLEETVAWYHDLLGLEVAEQWDDPGDRGCILAMPASRDEAYLEIYEGPVVAGFSNIGLQFRVDDVDGFQAPAEERFAFDGPVDRPWGSRYLNFTDPNGLSVVIFSGDAL